MKDPSFYVKMKDGKPALKKNTVQFDEIYHWYLNQLTSTSSTFFIFWSKKEMPKNGAAEPSSK